MNRYKNNESVNGNMTKDNKRDTEEKSCHLYRLR